MENANVLENNAITAFTIENISGTKETIENKTISQTNSIAASAFFTGLPILEIIRKLEDEKSLTRSDRHALKEALQDATRYHSILQSLRDVELGRNKRFALRRLKAIIYQNGSGQLNNSFISNNNKSNILQSNEVDPMIYSWIHLLDTPGNSPTRSSPNARLNHPGGFNSIEESDISDDENSLITNVTDLGKQVVGVIPTYKGTAYEKICNKIAFRMKEFFQEYQPSKMGTRKFGVIVGHGSFNPLTRMHTRAYFLAKQELENRHGYVILGSLLSPSHSVTVRERYRFNKQEVLPAPHRLAIAQLLVQDSKWLTIDPWEITRRRPLDTSMALIDHVLDMLTQQFSNIDIRVIYLCKSSTITTLALDSLKLRSCLVVCVCRHPESEQLKRNLGSKWNGYLHIVEDSAILDLSMDIISSRKVREKIRRLEDVNTFVGDSANEYIKVHNLSEKMNGEIEWNDEEKRLVPIKSGKYDPSSFSSAYKKMNFSSSLNSLSTIGENTIDSQPDSLIKHNDISIQHSIKIENHEALQLNNSDPLQQLDQQ